MEFFKKGIPTFETVILQQEKNNQFKEDRRRPIRSLSGSRTTFAFGEREYGKYSQVITEEEDG